MLRISGCASTLPIRYERQLLLRAHRDALRLPTPAIAQNSEFGWFLRWRIEHLTVAIEPLARGLGDRSEEHTSELQSLMRISYAVFCLKKKKQNIKLTYTLTE